MQSSHAQASLRLDRQATHAVSDSTHGSLIQRLRCVEWPTLGMFEASAHSKSTSTPNLVCTASIASTFTCSISTVSRSILRSLTNRSMAAASAKEPTVWCAATAAGAGVLGSSTLIGTPMRACAAEVRPEQTMRACVPCRCEPYAGGAILASGVWLWRRGKGALHSVPDRTIVISRYIWPSQQPARQVAGTTNSRSASAEAHRRKRHHAAELAAAKHANVHKARVH